MTFFSKCKTGNVMIDSIDLNNDEFKISKPLGDDRLKQSLQSFGLLDPPVVYKADNTYKIISGHNRLTMLKELNLAVGSVLCYITSLPEPGSFTDYAFLKNFRGEIGPIGKSKFIRILKNKFCLNENEILFAAKNMQIPGDFIYADQFEKVLSLGDPLKKYLDLKDIGFKIINNILRLPDEARVLLSNWVIDAGIRVNIFKNIVDLVVDINKINKIPALQPMIDLSAGDSTGNTARKDETLYRELFKIRYPEYTDIKLKAGKIIADIMKDGLEIDFPDYFERDEIGISLKINKRDNVEGFNKMLSRINTDALKRLLDLL
jgi:hypothetical protein